jgi:1,4-dihydroxy-2-naphthoate octaprenyltransferase
MTTDNTPSKWQAWLLAARLRTLPLATACILLGSFMAAVDGAFRWGVAVLALVTAVLLQILSNLANDYGDSVHGADSAARQGPKRAVQSGLIPAHAMRTGMIITATAAAITGLALIWLAFGGQAFNMLLIFVGLGAAAIAAAVLYTNGIKPYGYAGLGDLFVLIFFGWVGVMGTYFLQARTFNWLVMLPATSCGLLAVGVLNINNIRDIESDRQAGKFSVPVRIGLDRARLYHWLLLGGAVGLAVVYVVLTYHSPWQFLFVVSLPLLWKNGRIVATAPPHTLNPMLKQLSLSTLVFIISFGVGQIL